MYPGVLGMLPHVLIKGTIATIKGALFTRSLLNDSKHGG